MQACEGQTCEFRTGANVRVSPQRVSALRLHQRVRAILRFAHVATYAVPVAPCAPLLFRALMRHLSEYRSAIAVSTKACERAERAWRGPLCAKREAG
eukprot:6193436-Pleurochrysis_carterae.AAC.2